MSIFQISALLLTIIGFEALRPTPAVKVVEEKPRPEIYLASLDQSKLIRNMLPFKRL